MKKLDKLIKRLKKAKEIIAKDDIDDKIKAKMMAEMDRRGVGGKQIADHYRDVDETIPAKQRSNIKNALKQQKIKEQPKPKLAVVKSVEELADELIKSLSSLTKSNYGPKDMDLYNPTDNIKRKANNIGDEIKDIGKNKNVKAYSSKPGQLSAKAQAQLQSAQDKKKSAAMPIKHYSPKELAVMTAERLAKPVDKSLPEWDEDDMANALAKVAPLGQPSLQPSDKEFEQAALNSGMAVTQKQADTLNKNWGSAIQDFFSEVLKPISSRFSSKEEEEQYWNNIKINNSDAE